LFFLIDHREGLFRIFSLKRVVLFFRSRRDDSSCASARRTLLRDFLLKAGFDPPAPTQFRVPFPPHHITSHPYYTDQLHRHRAYIRMTLTLGVISSVRPHNSTLVHRRSRPLLSQFLKALSFAGLPSPAWALSGHASLPKRLERQGHEFPAQGILFFESTPSF